MKITCRVCGLSVHTQGEGFCLRKEDVKYCLKCGKSYLETGVDVIKLYNANDARVKCQLRIAFRLGILPAILYIITLAVLIYKQIIYVGPENFDLILCLIFVPPLQWTVIILMFAFWRGSKKFEKMVNS